MGGLKKKNELLQSKIDKLKVEKEWGKKQREIAAMEIMKETVKKKRQEKREREEEKAKIFSGKDLTVM